jgi:acetolactate synthase-1/2/3 large subunit
VFDKNYPARIAIEADAAATLEAIGRRLEGRSPASERDPEDLARRIAAWKREYTDSWVGAPQADRVSPGRFFRALRDRLPDDGIVVVDDGNHTYLTAELLPVERPRGFLTPTDFNCMGYCVPAAIGAKLACPEAPVVAIVGDGAMLMTGMETLTAARNGIGLTIFVFHDGELGQISQFQQIPLNRKTCTVLGDVDFSGMAKATGAAFLALESDAAIEPVIDEAMAISASSRPVIVDVAIDYSRRTRLTKGVVQTTLKRLPLREKTRLVVRALRRRITG